NDSSYDLVCAFEVLEHLPFDDFEKCLREMMRVSKKKVIISLPHFGPVLKLNFKIPLLKETKLMVKIPIPIMHKFNGQHYWEIGKKGFPSRKILNIIKIYFNIKKHFVAFQNPYHHFFVLLKKI
ncbi:class I SAM-dependent methyltransferase, partial [Patescibacteria group bacterium]|nr:class I SAM-dependent methyltransferase [Patescibacteria group bacterium]